MGSKTKVTKRRRQMRKAKAGRDRKRKLRRDGSTPQFPLDPEAEESS